jgi:hypothetical protein
MEIVDGCDLILRREEQAKIIEKQVSLSVSDHPHRLKHFSSPRAEVSDINACQSAARRKTDIQ